MIRSIEVRIGDVLFNPERRSMTGPTGSTSIEPQVSRVFDILSKANGGTVSRDTLFRACWGAASVGDDSLNRVIYQLRRSLRTIGSIRVTIETLSATGYSLKISELAIDQVCDEASRSWRQGLARADHDSIASLQSVLASADREEPRAWGILACHLARAAEYEPIERTADYVERCEKAASRALAIDPKQADAHVALSALRPLFGDWASARSKMLAVTDREPQNFAARHELAVLEMSTGRVSKAIPLVEALLEEDPLAATLHYKRGYHLYCLGSLDEMDRVLDNALQIWPGHAGIWQCRNMTLAFTGRAKSALDLLEDPVARPAMPDHTFRFHQVALSALVESNAEKLDDLVSDFLDMSGWQSLAVAAILYLSALDRFDAAMTVCEGYYLRGAKVPVKLRFEPEVETSINEMHRRATQPLFLPVTAGLRQHDRFMELCSKMGLVEYWKRTALRPDFLALRS